jgi:hypothetical protein
LELRKLFQAASPDLTEKLIEFILSEALIQFTPSGQDLAATESNHVNLEQSRLAALVELKKQVRSQDIYANVSKLCDENEGNATLCCLFFLSLPLEFQGLVGGNAHLDNKALLRDEVKQLKDQWAGLSGPCNGANSCCCK